MRVRTVIPILLAVVAALFACDEDSTGPNGPASPDSSRFAIIQTSMGNITIELDPEKAPITVTNFRRYASEHFYDLLIFHRVIHDFMIQGGGYNTSLVLRAPTYLPIQNEAGNGLSNIRGTISMARTSVVNSATSQFFINTKDNLFLDHHDDTQQGYGYAVFGRVVDGMEVVDSISALPTGPRNGLNDVPLTTATVYRVVMHRALLAAPPKN